MLFEDKSNFQDFIKPLNYFNGFMGLGFYRQPDTSNAACLCMRVYTILAIMSNWVVTYIGTSVSIKDMADRLETSTMGRTMHNVLVTTNSCVAVTASVFIWLQRKELTTCLREMPILDHNFQVAVGARNEYRKRHRNLVLNIIVITLVVIFATICDITWITIGERSLWIHFFVVITLHYPIIVLLVLDLNFCTFVCYVGKKFRDLNESLLNLVENPHTSVTSGRLFVVSRNVVRPTLGNGIKNDVVADSIDYKLNVVHEVRRLHLQLCKLSRKINHVFAIQNLLSMAISFVMITGLLYTVYGSISRANSTLNKLEEIIPALIWIAIYAYKIWRVNHSCSGVSDEFEKTGEVVYELLTPRIDAKLQKEVQEFAVQMLQNPVRFNACGFFTLDYTFVQGVIGSITTYLVILIQMSQVSETTASELLGNGTNT